MKSKHFVQKNTEHLESELLAETFVTRLEHIKLPVEAKDEMRANLLAYAELHAEQTTKPVQNLSPFSLGFIFESFTSYTSTYPRSFFAGALAIVAIFGGAGISEAAQNSLPGDPLYSVKVSILEPIQGSFITSVAEQAQWENVLTERRLTEATTLAIQNKLATSTQQYIAQAVATHVALAQQDARALSASGDTASAADVRTDLVEKLSTNATVLSQIVPQLDSAEASTTDATAATTTASSDDTATTTSTTIAVAALLQDVSADIDATVALGGTATSTSVVAAEATSTISATVAGLPAEVTTVLVDSSSTDATSTTEILATTTLMRAHKLHHKVQQ